MKLTKQSEDFPAWYQEVIHHAKLAEHSPVKGCMIMLPNGYSIWELLRDQLDVQIKAHGAKNVYFPMFIPEEYLRREKEHVEGFSPELAVVTIGGGKTLSEPLVVRPTSETIIYDAMSRWIQSHRDLPMRLNQWANVVRWELRPRLFLRTTEFLWQEGHTAHATAREAKEQVSEITSLYKRFSEEVLAIPVVTGRKSDSEKFAGAVYSESIEGLMQDGKALQMGTVHYLGTNFAKPFRVKYSSEEGPKRHVHQTSWGVSTRLIGALIMVHGDDSGLRLPPRVAPIQAVVLPIFKKGKDTSELTAKAKQIAESLDHLGVRVEIDDSTEMSPGAKFYHWERQGVPVRLELGQKELEGDTVSVALRVPIEGNKKMQISTSLLGKEIPKILNRIQEEMFAQAAASLATRHHFPTTKDEFREQIESRAGFLQVPWCGTSTCEADIKSETKATSRNLPFEPLQQPELGVCIWCGRPAQAIANFSLAY